MGLKCDGVDWIQMVQNKVQWRPILNTLTSLGVVGFNVSYEEFYCDVTPCSLVKVKLRFEETYRLYFQK
jgi:hypothetical protein